MKFTTSHFVKLIYSQLYFGEMINNEVVRFKAFIGLNILLKTQVVIN